MKKILVGLLLLAFGNTVKAQLANTKWLGTMNVPQATTIIINFTNETIGLSFADSQDLIESMSYTIKGDTLIAKKESGGSPCDVGSTLKVKYTIKDDQLFITPLSDPCEERLHAWSTEAYVKQK